MVKVTRNTSAIPPSGVIASLPETPEFKRRFVQDGGLRAYSSNPDAMAEMGPTVRVDHNMRQDRQMAPDDAIDMDRAPEGSFAQRDKVQPGVLATGRNSKADPNDPTGEGERQRGRPEIAKSQFDEVPNRDAATYGETRSGAKNEDEKKQDAKAEQDKQDEQAKQEQDPDVPADAQNVQYLVEEVRDSLRMIITYTDAKGHTRRIDKGEAKDAADIKAWEDKGGKAATIAAGVKSRNVGENAAGKKAGEALNKAKAASKSTGKKANADARKSVEDDAPDDDDVGPDEAEENDADGQKTSPQEKQQQQPSQEPDAQRKTMKGEAYDQSSEHRLGRMIGEAISGAVAAVGVKASHGVVAGFRSTPQPGPAGMDPSPSASLQNSPAAEKTQNPSHDPSRSMANAPVPPRNSQKHGMG